MKDAKGDSIAHYAASGAALELLDEVLDKNYADLSQSQFWSPLHWACRIGDPEIIGLLMRKGASNGCVATAQPSRKWTPYSIAVLHQNQHLLSASGDVYNFLLGSDAGVGEELVNMKGERHDRFSCNGCLHVISLYVMTFEYVLTLNRTFTEPVFIVMTVTILIIVLCAG